jgi:hypothetical protein
MNDASESPVTDDDLAAMADARRPTMGHWCSRVYTPFGCAG